MRSRHAVHLHQRSMRVGGLCLASAASHSTVLCCVDCRQTMHPKYINADARAQHAQQFPQHLAYHTQVAPMPMMASVPVAHVPYIAKKGYSAVGDNWGILGLQPLNASSSFQGAPADGNDNSASLMYLRGFDLDNLGLALSNMQELVYPVFSSPWSDIPQKIQPDFRLPPCYFIAPPHLKYTMFQKFEDATLLYIFYSMPKDVLQLAAARALQQRQWRFHKELKQWFKRAPDSELGIKTSTFERSSYLFFNVEKWASERKDDFVINYAEVEEPDAAGQARQ